MVHDHHTVFIYCRLNSPLANAAGRFQVTVQDIFDQRGSRLNDGIHFFISLIIRNMRYIFCRIRGSDLYAEGIHRSHIFPGKMWSSCRKVHSLRQFFSCILCHAAPHLIHIRSNFFSALIAAESFSLSNDYFSITVRCFFTNFSLNTKTVFCQLILWSVKYNASLRHPAADLLFHFFMFQSEIAVICGNHQNPILFQFSPLNFVAADYIHLIAQIAADLVPAQQIQTANLVIPHFKRLHMRHF